MTFHRRIALLGGTTNFQDCLVAMGYLAHPGELIEGGQIRKYEDAFARTIGVRHACSFASARVGFYGLLRALGVGLGDEVILQVPTHIVVSNAIRYTGARPVYADCSLETYNLNLEEMDALITPRTRVLLIQHTFGIPVEMEAVLSLAGRHGLAVIEDCVHALGSRYGGRLLGSFGRAAFFSTEETKTISTTMGGMVVTDDSDLAAKMRTFQGSCPPPPFRETARRLLKLVLYHFLTEPYLHRYTRSLYEILGRRHPLPRPTTGEELRGLRPRVYEQRLSNGQAALGLRQLSRLESNLEHRREISRLYGDWFKEKKFHPPVCPEKSQPAFVRYPVWIKNRPKIANISAPHAVLGTWFTSVLEECLSPALGNYVEGSCPLAESAARHLINLPTHPRVKVRDAEVIAEEVLRMLS